MYIKNLKKSLKLLKNINYLKKIHFYYKMKIFQNFDINKKNKKFSKKLQKQISIKKSKQNTKIFTFLKNLIIIKFCKKIQNFP